MSFYITLAIVVAIVLGVIAIFNSLVSLRNRHQNAFSQIEVQLKRRYDLIPNIVETAKAYMEHEKGTLEAVISARNQAISGLSAASADPSNAAAISQLAGAESGLSSALGRLNVVMEAYPELKANENMMQVTEELTSTENRIAFSRQGFNDAVMAYNEYKQKFPAVIFAGMFGHGNDASLLEFADSAAIQEAPKVKF